MTSEAVVVSSRYAGPYDMPYGDYAGFEQHTYWKTKLFNGSCPDCSQAFDDPASLLVHRPCFENSGFLRNREEVNDGKCFCCQYCGNRFPALANLKQHIRYHLIARYVCNHCEFAAFTPYEVKNHFNSVHVRPLPSTTLQLPVIPVVRTDTPPRMDYTQVQVSTSEESPSMHYDNYIEIKTLEGTCPDCGRNDFQDEVSFYCHEPCLKKYQQGRLMVCQFCTKSFTTSWILKKHLMTHFEETYSCKQCLEDMENEVSFKSHNLNDIRRHIKSHFKDLDNKKSISCTYPGCPSTFNIFADRKLHFTTTHMNSSGLIEAKSIEEPTKVSQTQANGNITSASLSELGPPNERNVDYFWHLIPSKNYRKTCRKNFDDPATLKVHDPCFRKTPYYKGHKSRRSCCCSFCGMAFSKMNKLRLHMYGHFDAKFVCKICGVKKSNHRVIRHHVLSHSLNSQGDTPSTQARISSTTLLNKMPPGQGDSRASRRTNDGRQEDYEEETQETGIKMLDFGTFVPPSVKILDFCVI